MSNHSLAREYLTWLSKTRGRTGLTTYQYASTLNQFLAWIGTTPLDRVSLRQCETFLARPRGGRAGGNPGSPATQSKDGTIVRQLYTYLHNRGHVGRNPAALLGAPTIKNRNPRPIPDDDWVTLWGADLTRCERVAFGLGFFCGLRRNEITTLRTDQVVPDASALLGFTRKGGGDDVVYYGDLLRVFEVKLPHLGAERFVPCLHAFRATRNSHPFLIEWGHAPARTAVHDLPDGQTAPDRVNRALHDTLVRLGLPHYTPHQLRHSFVTNLIRAGVPLHVVSRLANHTNQAVTERYLKVGGGDLAEWLRQIDRHQ